jgi:Na+-driven multidrug efflux pump
MLSCYSLRGLDIVSSFNIANTISNVFLTVGTSLGNATAIIIGSMLGAKKVDEAKSSCLKIIGFAFMVSLVFAVVEVISGFIVPNIYDTTEAIKEMSKIFIIISACLLPINCINTVIYFTIRAGGRMLLTVLFDAVFVMVVRVPIAFILSKYTNLSIYLIYGIATGIDFVKIFLGGYFIKKGVWIRFII